jgi:hypothetical protein
MTVPIADFGQDHWSTLAYLETRAVDHRGLLQREHMRVDPARHPLHAHRGSQGMVSPTRLAANQELDNHDDYDVIDDLVAAGLLHPLGGTGLQPRVALTEEGWRVAGLLRRWRAAGCSFNAFALGDE